MKSIKGKSRVKINVKRSIFIATARRVDSVQEARDFISGIKKEFNDATHNCWAFRVFESESVEEGFSDAGEPSGTAGIPILNAIREKDLLNVAVVVTRYFGGVKLGTKGLKEAYHRAALKALESAEIVNLRRVKIFKVEVTLEDYGRVIGRISRNGKILAEDFSDTVVIAYSSEEPLIDGSVEIGERLVEW